MNFFARLSVVQRISLLGGSALVLLIGLMGTQISQQWIERNQALSELNALPVAGKLLASARLSAEHRGMANGYLGGNDAFRDKLEAKRGELDAALAQTAEAITQLQAGSRATSLLQTLRTDWKALADGVAGRSLPAKQSFARHSALIESQLALLEELMATQGLALDGDPVSHSMIDAALSEQPWVSEALGRVRGVGAGMLSKPAFDSHDQAVIGATLDAAKRSFDAARVALERAGALDASVKAELAAAMSKADAGFAEGVALAEAQLLQAPEPKMKGPDFFAAMTQTIAAQQEVAKASFAVLERRTAAAANSALRHIQLEVLLSALALAGMLLLMVSLARSVRQSARAAIETSKALAEGDFSARQNAATQDEFGAIALALDEARVDVSRAVHEVRVGVESLAEATREIQQGSHDLSSRTEQQASTLEETASSMEHLKGLVGRSSQDAVTAGQRAAEVSHHAERGGEVMTQVVKTMTEISESSKQIGGIVALIDSIAFQTNILALNAAVEAARAGEQGRGFAVVASEVRTLAQRSGEAAREIRRMIEQSGERIDAGNQFVVSAGKSMELIVSEVRGVTELLQRIGANAREHAESINQVSDAVSQLDQVTQANAALAEQSAAAAESLRDQAERLAESVSRFKLAQ